MLTEMLILLELKTPQWGEGFHLNNKYTDKFQVGLASPKSHDVFLKIILFFILWELEGTIVSKDTAKAHHELQEVLS